MKKNRFILLCKKYLAENNRMLIYGIGAFLAFWIIIGGWCGWLNTGGGGGTTFFYSFICMLLWMVISSMMFKDMNGKEKRISTLMTPASAAEKFWLRFIVTVPLYLVVVVIGYCMMELSRMLFNVIDHGFANPFYWPFNTVFTADHEMTLAILLLIAVVMFDVVMYMVGAICWPKYSFLKTTALQFGFQTLAIMILSIVGSHYFLNSIFLTDEGEILTMLWCFTGVLYLLDIFGMWFTYYKFKTKTL